MSADTVRGMESSGGRPAGAAGVCAPVLLVCAPTAYTGGGVEEWLGSLEAVLRARGWRVVVALAEGARFHRPDLYLARHPYRDTRMLSARRGWREERVLAVTRLILRLRPDVVMPLQLADALYAASRLKTVMRAPPRLVACLHGQAPDVVADLTACGEALDLAVSVSRQGAKTLAAAGGVPADRIAHIPTGVPPPLGRVRHEHTRLELGYIGRLDRAEKRIGDLVELVETLDSDSAVRFHVCGDGPDDDWLRARLAPAVAAGRVTLHGRLPREELYRAIYPRLDGLLVFSGAEGGPMVAWEALAHGVVPLVSDFAGRLQEDVLHNDVNSLVFPVGDVAAAVRCVVRLRDAAVHARLRAAAELPPAYTLEGFGDAWDRQLRAVAERPARHPRRAPPAPVSPGRLAVPGLAWLTYALRRLTFRRAAAAAGPGDEWPHAYNGQPGVAADPKGCLRSIFRRRGH